MSHQRRENKISFTKTTNRTKWSLTSIWCLVKACLSLKTCLQKVQTLLTWLLLCFFNKSRRLNFLGHKVQLYSPVGSGRGWKWLSRRWGLTSDSLPTADLPRNNKRFHLNKKIVIQILVIVSLEKFIFFFFFTNTFKIPSLSISLTETKLTQRGWNVRRFGKNLP